MEYEESEGTRPSLRSVESEVDSLELLKSESPAIDTSPSKASVTGRLSRAIKSFGSQIDRSASPKLLETGDIISPQPRRLQKLVSQPSVLGRLSHRLSKSSTTSSLRSHTQSPASNLQQSAWKHGIVLRHGPLATTTHLLWTKTGYLVLTDEHLIKFGNANSAFAAFPQLCDLGDHRNPRSSPAKETASAEALVQIPLRQIIATYNEEGTSPQFGIDMWYATHQAVSHLSSQFFFEHPQERDEWLAAIHRVGKEAAKNMTASSLVPRNVAVRIQQHVASVEPPSARWALDIFPVAMRLPPGTATPGTPEQQKRFRDGCAYYLVLGQYLGFLVRVQKMAAHTPPEDLVLNVHTFGLVSLTRFRATVNPRDERFVVIFRLPRQLPARLEMASRFYKHILLTFVKADRCIKPSWPHQMQRAIFDVRGFHGHLHIPPGEDYGHLRTSLEAWCAAFDCDPLRLRIEWDVTYAPELRVLPSDKPGGYSREQFVALLRALRFNDYFKSISFKDVDLSCMTGLRDTPGYLENIADVNRAGIELDDDHREIIVASPLLLQELHAVFFTCGSFKSVDFTNVFASQTKAVLDAREMGSGIGSRKLDESIEIMRPILLLLQKGLSQCESLIFGGNPLCRFDIGELAATLRCGHVRIKRLELAGCSLLTTAIGDIWLSLRGQRQSLEVLDLSNNLGKVDTIFIKDEVCELVGIRKLGLSGIALPAFQPLIPEDAYANWKLEELDLSFVKLSPLTIVALSKYLAFGQSTQLRSINLRKCGLSGTLVAELFRSLGEGRKMVINLNDNQVEWDGIEELCDAIANSLSPSALLMERVEFRELDSYLKLIRALTTNRSTRLLSLAGTAPRGVPNAAIWNALRELFMKNDSLQYLDFSGHGGILDQSHVGQGFARALSGLRENAALHHLRIRGQGLEADIGELADVVARNGTLRTLDLGDNDFGLSSLSFLVKSLGKNGGLERMVVFTDEGLAEAVEESVASLTAPRLRSSAKGSEKGQRSSEAGAMSEGLRRLASQLRGEWGAQVEQMNGFLERNRERHNENAAAMKDMGAQGQDLGSDEIDYDALFGGLAVTDFEEKKPLRLGGPAQTPRGSTTTSEPSTPSQRRGSPGKLVTAPHHVSGDEMTLESPSTDAGTDRYVLTPTGSSISPTRLGSPLEGVSSAALPPALEV